MDVVAVFDSDRRFVFVNDAACGFYERPREEIVGARLDDFIGAERAEADWKDFLTPERIAQGMLANVWDGEQDGRRTALEVRATARVPARPAPVRHPRHHRAADPRGAAAPGAEDGGGRPARRRDRARLQQPADRDRGLRRDRAAADRRRARLGRARGDRARRRPRRRTDEAAARVRAPAGARAGAAERQRRRGAPGADARAADRRGDRDRDARRPRPAAGARRPRAARAGRHQPRDQRSRRDARRRHAGDRDLGARRPRAARGVRHRHRHRRGGAGADLRAVLHHQGRRARDRPRAGDRARDRDPVGRTRRGALRPGAGVDVHGLAARRRGRAGAEDAGAPARGAAAARRRRDPAGVRGRGRACARSSSSC